MCKYCEIEECEYEGELIPFDKKVDGTKQHYEVSILQDIEYEQMSLRIDGTFSDLRIKIKFCPMCGKELFF
ncbi:hypothetical protein CVD28_03660 [Bacillus sp. M6-12]|uniref:hypothetical protein n=1 Tax=Bacillus sp. M6-12 TaxID=2054166 RepID=UPI000C75AB77|nr:hypothetical protein [Bacillus sp. M6-12]PLS19524.1 hypothetical protein CVD28_03660 [Bacillus sp. M6-12]